MLSTFEMNTVDSFNFQRIFFLLMNSVDWDNYFAFNPKNSKIENLSWSLLCSWNDFEFGNALLAFGRFAGSTMGSDMLIFFRDFPWRSGLLEYWIQWYVRGYCFGCSLLPGTLKVGFICPFVVIDPTDLGATTELLFQALCLFIFNVSPTQNILLFCRW